MGTRTRWLGVIPTALLVLAACSEPQQSIAIPDIHASPSTTVSPTPVRVVVPGVGGMSVADARVTLRSLGLRTTVTLHFSSKPKGTVLTQAIGAGESVRPRRVIHLVVAKPEPPPPCGVFGNPWCYTFAGGNYISNPPANFCSYFNCISSFWDGRGHVIQCQDGWFSKSGGISGSCSYHGGNWRYLYSP
jgi:hypothetical protein